MAEHNLATSPLYNHRQAGGQEEKAAYRGTSLRSAQTGIDDISGVSRVKKITGV